MTKKTDAESLLSAARRSLEVPRPQGETANPSQMTIAPAPVAVKRVNVAVRSDLHRRLKLLSVQQETTVQELADQLLAEALEKQGI